MLDYALLGGLGGALLYLHPNLRLNWPLLQAPPWSRNRHRLHQWLDRRYCLSVNATKSPTQDRLRLVQQSANRWPAPQHQ